MHHQDVGEMGERGLPTVCENYALPVGRLLKHSGIIISVCVELGALQFH